MSDEKFAVYVVMVDDSAASDEKLMDSVYTGKRIGGDFTWVEAEDAVESAETINSDRA